MTNLINPIIIDGFDVEEIAEALVNNEGFEGMTYTEILAIVLHSDELAEAVYADIASRWDEPTAFKALVG